MAELHASEKKATYWRTKATAAAGVTCRANAGGEVGRRIGLFSMFLNDPTYAKRSRLFDFRVACKMTT